MVAEVNGVTLVAGTDHDDDTQAFTGNPVEEADAAYEQAIGNPPPGGWSAEEQATIDEIEALEAQDHLTVADQIRLVELKADFAHGANTLSDADHDRLSNVIDHAKQTYQDAMTTGNDDLHSVNEAMGVLEILGIHTADSPLEAKRDRLTQNPEMALSESLRYQAIYHGQMATSYAEGSDERAFHEARASMLHDAANQLDSSGVSIGTTDIDDYENLTFADLDAMDADMMEAQAEVFRELGDAREEALRAEYAAQGYSTEEIDEMIAQDPLLNYYRGREELATQTATELSNAGDNPTDLLNIRMGYQVQVAQMDQIYYSSMADLAGRLGDEDAKNFFQSRASEASDREGSINQSWQTLINLLTDALNKAANS